MIVKHVVKSDTFETISGQIVSTVNVAKQLATRGACVPEKCIKIFRCGAGFVVREYR